jgi:hypothetical protein
VKLYGGFPLNHTGTKSEITSLINRFAVRFHLVSGNLKGRAYLKRISMGKLIRPPAEITEGMVPYDPPVEIPSDEVTKDHKILYAIGHKHTGS